MSPIETALLASINHRTEVHYRWTQLIAQATPTNSGTTTSTVPVASPRRTQLAASSNHPALQIC